MDPTYTVEFGRAGTAFVCYDDTILSSVHLRKKASGLAYWVGSLYLFYHGGRIYLALLGRSSARSGENRREHRHWSKCRTVFTIFAQHVIWYTCDCQHADWTGLHVAYNGRIDRTADHLRT